jgi:hypothetical protein
MVGVGATGLAIGGGYFVAAEAKRDELDEASEFQKDAIRANADQRERIGTVSVVAGGVVTLVGVALLAYNPRPQWKASAGARSLLLGFQVSF